MLSVNRKSQMMRQMMKLQLFGTPKSCVFEEHAKKYLINLISRVRLSKKLSHIRRSREIIIYLDGYWNK